MVVALSSMCWSQQYCVKEGSYAAVQQKTGIMKACLRSMFPLELDADSIPEGGNHEGVSQTRVPAGSGDSIPKASLWWLGQTQGSRTT